jgi:nucleotide-binding universal stress UspA family protein
VNGPVICGIEDANDESVGAVARELAQRFGLPVSFVHVLHRRDGNEEATRRLREATVPDKNELAIERGHPADRLVELTREQAASFLVVGNHGPRSSLLGSISADVSRRASCPVVVVPRTAQAVAQTQAGGSDPDVRAGTVRSASATPWHDSPSPRFRLGGHSPARLHARRDAAA